MRRMYSNTELTRCDTLYSIKVKKTGGISFIATCPLTHVDEKLVQMILHEYSIYIAVFCIIFVSLLSFCKFVRLEIFNAEVLFREDCTAGQPGLSIFIL